jgi:hypothetical protein
VGISETIVAAMIGAIATVTTALFQLYAALRTKVKSDVRQRSGSMRRSVLAILALMVASAAGGFLYSEFMKQRANEDVRAMRQELKDLKELTARFAEESRRAARVDEPLAQGEADARLIPAGVESDRASVESIVYVPACRRADAQTPCTEADAQRVALCGAIPAFARVERIELFVQPDAVQNAWEEHRAQLDEDVGGARFTGGSFEYAQGLEQKAVCVNFMQWSSERPHIARIVVQYGFGEAPRVEPPTAIFDAPPAHVRPVMAADAVPSLPQAAARR